MGSCAELRKKKVCFDSAVSECLSKDLCGARERKVSLARRLRRKGYGSGEVRFGIGLKETVRLLVRR